MLDPRGTLCALSSCTTVMVRFHGVCMCIDTKFWLYINGAPYQR